ncbi:MAG: 30S ribosomal protein S20 [Nitrospinota bacterium]
MRRSPSVLKRQRQNERRRRYNASIRHHVKTAIKRTQQALETKEPAAAESALKRAHSVLSRASAKGVLHRRTAARKASRLAKRVHRALSSGEKP